jgi:RNA polymerase sigma-70 factor (ECF subfamily)
MTGTDAVAIAASLEDPEAFVRVFDHHFDAIARYLRRRLDRATADDLASEVFTIAFSRRASYDQRQDDARPWLYGIAANLIRTRARNQEVELRALARLANHAEAFDYPMEPQLGWQDHALAAGLLDLSSGDREVLLLFAWADLDYGQIATALRLPVGTVKSRLNRARRAVRDALDLNEPFRTEEVSCG